MKKWDYDDIQKWLTVNPSAGKQMGKSNIYPCKAPLDDALLHAATGIPNFESFTCADLARAIPNLGLVINLCNTKKWYDPSSFAKLSIAHVWLPIPGRALPPSETVANFIDIVDNFTYRFPKLSIAVHCTHGINRTGYILCSATMKRNSSDFYEAHESFSAARGLPMNKKEFIDHLTGKGTYKEPDEVVVSPVLS